MNEERKEWLKTGAVLVPIVGLFVILGALTGKPYPSKDFEKGMAFLSICDQILQQEREDYMAKAHDGGGGFETSGTVSVDIRAENAPPANAFPKEWLKEIETGVSRYATMYEMKAECVAGLPYNQVRLNFVYHVTMQDWRHLKTEIETYVQGYLDGKMGHVKGPEKRHAE